MAWYSDEEYEFRQDCIEKKITARSARSTRTHNGKRGAVKFPSDYMTKKELKAMNGECFSYRMNSPLTWDEFKSWPDEHKVTYVKLLREKFNVPNNALAEMFGVGAPVLCRYFKCLGLAVGSGIGGKRSWDKEGFLAWRAGVKTNDIKKAVEETSETTTAEEIDMDNVIPAVKLYHGSYTDGTEKIIEGYPIVRKTIVPMSGEMTFEGSVNDILRAINSILDCDNVRLTVKWEILKE